MEVIQYECVEHPVPEIQERFAALHNNPHVNLTIRVMMLVLVNCVASHKILGSKSLLQKASSFQMAQT